MISEDGIYIICDRVGGCENKIKNHRWAKASRPGGWFFSKSGKSFCPKHVPSWVKNWRVAP